MTNIKIGTKLGPYEIEVKSEFIKDEQSTVCPVCCDTHKSVSGAKDRCGSMNLGKGTYHCNRCGVGGVVITDRSFVDTHNRIKAMETKFAKSDITPDYIQWLSQERSISQTTAEAMNLHVVNKTIKWDIIPEDFPDREKYVGNYYVTPCLAAFYIYKDQLINIQYRDKWKNFTFESGCDLVFFNADVIATNKIVMITEGWMDAVACREAGLTNVISVPNGATITPDEKKIFERTGMIEILSEPTLKYLDNCWDDFENVEEIVLATDDDAAGQKLMEVLRRRFVNARKRVSRINFNTLPEDPTKKRKDFNDVLKYYGKDAVISLYENRKQFGSPSVVRLKDVEAEIDRHFNGEVPKARKLGWIDMDPHFGWFPGDIIVGNGYPSNGKTTFILNALVAMAKRYNTRSLIYSPENMPPSRFLETVMEIYAGKSIDKKDRRSFMTSGGISYQEAKDWVDEFFPVAIKRTAFTLPELRELAVQENCQNLFIDPWNRMARDSKHYRSNIDQYIQDELTEQIIFGLDTGCTTIISVHPPTQEGKDRKYNKETGGFDHPSAFQAEGGKVWYSSSHVMFCVHRPPLTKETAKQTLLYVQKLKIHKYYGRPNGDLDPLIFEMITSCNRLLLNKQTPLDGDSPLQLDIYEERKRNITIADSDNDDPF